MKNATQTEILAEDFISFLQTYELDDYSELLYDALYCLVTEGEPSDRKQLIYHALYSIRVYLDRCKKEYLAVEEKKEILE